MVFHVITIFPRFFEGPFDCGIVGRARESGIVDIRFHDLRECTTDRHRTVDDRPFGGDEGMVIKIEPVFESLEKIRQTWPGKKTRTILLSAQGRCFDQAAAARWARCDEIAFICGRYEGVDERINTYLADEEISVGDFVLTGGEWACGMIIDSVARLLPGVLGNEASARRESFQPGPDGRAGILDCPHYTRPAKFRDWAVPEVLLSGNHEAIRRWRRGAALEKTWKNRPDLLDRAGLSIEDRKFVETLSSARRT